MATLQNTPLLIGGTLSTSMKSAHVRELMRFTKETGYSLSDIFDRAIGHWLACEAPVHGGHVRKQARGKLTLVQKA
jgi:hypothetical protein